MTSRILLAGAAVAALLAACDRQPETPPAAPVEQAALPAGVALAPAAPEALPPAPPARVAAAPVDQGARYWRQAEEDDRYYDDRPPSYAYDYGEESPAVWLDGEMVRRVVERLAGGGERSYYYRPGQERPYYVQDPYYGYGYDDGALVTVYDVRRREALDRQATRARAAEAGRYLARSQALRRAALQAERQDRRQLDAQQWRQWQARRDRRATPVQPTPPPPVVAPPARDDRDDFRDWDGRGRDRDRDDRRDRMDPNDRYDRGDRGRGEQDRPRGDRPVATPVPVPTPTPKAVAAEKAREQAVAAQKAREEALRVARLKREADLKARREAAAARLKPPQTPAPPAKAVAPAKPATPALKPEVPAAKGAPLFAPKLSKTERQKAAMAAKAAEQARKAKAKADAEAAQAARAKAAADKAAADAAAAAAAVTPKP